MRVCLLPNPLNCCLPVREGATFDHDVTATPLSQILLSSLVAEHDSNDVDEAAAVADVMSYVTARAQGVAVSATSS